MPLIRSIPSACALFLAACGGEPFPPPANAIIGNFGGTRTQLEASGHFVRVISTCSLAFFPSAIVPDVAGNFVLPPTPVAGLGNASVQLEVRGRIDGDRIFATVITMTRAGALVEQRTLTRDTPADFSGFACAANDPKA